MSADAPTSERPPMIAGRVRSTIERADPRDIAALAEFPTGLVSDCLNRMGAMDGRIRPIAAARPFCGSAVTVEEVEGGNLMSHAALELVRGGDVLVIDAKGITTRASWGAVQSQAAARLGVAAVVVNGVVRDRAEIVAGALPVYALGACAAGPLKSWGGNVNLPIACGGVAVCPGDAVLGDDDGVVVVARELVAQLPALCAQRQEMEQTWTARVADGQSTLDAVGLRRTLESQQIHFE